MARKHSNGAALLFTTTQAAYAFIYDIDRVVAAGGRNGNQGLVGKVPIATNDTMYGAATRAYHDFYVGYDPATHQDKFYGAAIRGYYVYDVSKPEEPKLLTSIMGAAGVEGEPGTLPM